MKMPSMRKLCSVLLLFICVHGNAQNNVGIGTLTPDASALLDLTTSDKGFLAPRLTAAQRTAISSPAIGLLVYDTDAACFFYYKNGTDGWINLCSAVNVAIGSTGIHGHTGYSGYTGATGVTGLVGATGLQGITGYTGATGLVGETGIQGSIGATGSDGNDGEIGVTGATGNNGTNGEIGVTGATGTNGTNGEIGVTGATGTNGTNGEIGVTGATGNNGVIGVTGATGNNGTNGTIGVTGTTGNNGNNGVIGITGTTGNNGTNGTIGVTGTTGNNGNNGVIGVTGATGNNGNNGVIGVTGTTGNNGTNGVIGVTGATGNNGTNGVIGVTGTTGNNGTNGVIGVTGATGNNGTNGTIGITGATGNNGNNGVIGVTGTTGNNGTNGAIGVTGATGNNGEIGVTGATGNNGNNGEIGVTGTTGNNGNNGEIGITGATGNNGTNGTIGITGATGNNGEIGVTGATGNNGNNGEIGITGATGNNGTNGVIGVTGITGNNGINGEIGVTGATGPVGCTGTNFLIKSTGTSATCTVAPVFEDYSGNVGIGTIIPTALIDINGTTRIRSLGAGYVKSDASGNLSSGAIAAADIPSGSGNYIQNQTTQQASSNFNISGAGVIGTNLTVGGKTYLNTSTGQGSGAHGISWYNPSYVTWYDYIAPAGSSNAPNATAAPSDATSGVTSWARRFNIENNSDFGWLFESGPNTATAPTVKFAINSGNGTFHSTGDGIIDGNVGIGVLPTQKLDVNGNINNRGILYQNTSFGQGSGAHGISWYNPSFYTWYDYMAPAGSTNAPSSAAAPTDAASGVTSWARRFNIENISGYGWLFESGSNTNAAAPTVKFAINSSNGTFHSTGDGIIDGSVGINTTAPATKLHILGQHSTSRIRLTLPAADNGAATGDVNMQLWVSEPGITWEGGGIGTNVNNDNGTPAGFGRLNTGLGQSYIRFITNGGGMTFSTTDNAGNSYANTMYMAGGRVGVGTTSITQAKFVVSGFVSVNYGGYGALYNGGSGSTLIPGVQSNLPASIYASDRIYASEIDAFSDQRIKNIKGVSNSAADLEILSGIEITDYTFKDSVVKGNKPYKKVIAQQVEKVYPQAVSNLTDVIPDIYKFAEINEGWVNLETDLKKGERVKLILENKQEIYEVVDVSVNSFKVKASEKGKVFVYGREVNDFRSVDYEAIGMLNVSATQELLKLVKGQQKQINRLTEQNQTLQEQLNEIKHLIEK